MKDSLPDDQCAFLGCTMIASSDIESGPSPDEMETRPVCLPHTLLLGLIEQDDPSVSAFASFTLTDPDRTLEFALESLTGSGATPEVVRSMLRTVD